MKRFPFDVVKRGSKKRKRDFFVLFIFHMEAIGYFESKNKKFPFKLRCEMVFFFFEIKSLLNSPFEFTIWLVFLCVGNHCCFHFIFHSVWLSLTFKAALTFWYFKYYEYFNYCKLIHTLIMGIWLNFYQIIAAEYYANFNEF